MVLINLHRTIVDLLAAFLPFRVALSLSLSRRLYSLSIKKLQMQQRMHNSCYFVIN